MEDSVIHFALRMSAFAPNPDIGVRSWNHFSRAPVFRPMPYFHFQVRTESHVLLTEGLELKGFDEARIEAARRVGDLLKEHAGQIWTDEDWRMDVTDRKGLILFVLQVLAAKSAATASVASVES